MPMTGRTANTDTEIRAALQQEASTGGVLAPSWATLAAALSHCD
jgi:hypothetical protein